MNEDGRQYSQAGLVPPAMKKFLFGLQVNVDDPTQGADEFQSGPKSPTVSSSTPPITGEDCILLGERKPVIEAESLLSSLTAQIRSLDSKFTDEIRKLKEESLLLERDNYKLKILWDRQNDLIKREALCGFYTVFGLNRNAPRKPIPDYLRTQGVLLQEIFGHSQEEITNLIKFLDTTTIIPLGNDAARHFKLADAVAAIGEGEEPLGHFISLLVEKYGQDVWISDAVKQLEKI